MGIWLTELRRNLPADIVLHVVGTKADIVARDPSKREVPFERCIAYVAENLAPGQGSTPPPTAGGLVSGMLTGNTGGFPGLAPGAANLGATAAAPGQMASSSANPSLNVNPPPPHPTPFLPPPEPRSPSSKRSSGFWGQEAGWDACHEISAESGEGVEEVFRVVTRKLVEQNRKMQQALLAATSTPGGPPSMNGDGSYGSASGAESSHGHGYGYGGGYFDGNNTRGSFRVGRDRRSWIFPSGYVPDISVDPNGTGASGEPPQNESALQRRSCC